MSFLPDWWSQGVQGQDNNGGFGTANMFNKPMPQQQGGLGKIGALIAALRNKSQDPTQGASPMPQSNQMPQMTPYQAQQVAPNMGQVNPMQPKQPFPNYYSDNQNGGY